MNDTIRFVNNSAVLNDIFNKQIADVDLEPYVGHNYSYWIEKLKP